MPGETLPMKLRCLIGQHRSAVSVVGMTERGPDGMRVLAGYRCVCGALVFQRTTSWRGGVAAVRALKREVAQGRT